MSHDAKCEELARYFLVLTVRGANVAEAVPQLAQVIQDAVDTYLGIHLCMRCKALLSAREVPNHDLCKSCRNESQA